MLKRASNTGSSREEGLSCNLGNCLWKGNHRESLQSDVEKWMSGRVECWEGRGSSSSEHKLEAPPHPNTKHTHTLLVEWCQRLPHVPSGCGPPHCHCLSRNCNWTIWRGASYPITRSVHAQQCVSSQRERPDLRGVTAVNRASAGPPLREQRS